MPKTSFDVVEFIRWSMSGTPSKKYRVDKIGKTRLFSIRYGNTAEYKSAIYLSVLLDEHGIPVPKPVIAFKRVKLIIFEYLHGKLLKDLPPAEKKKGLQLALKLLTTFRQLRPSQKHLALKPMKSRDFERIALHAFDISRSVGLIEGLSRNLRAEVMKVREMLEKFDNDPVFIHHDFQSRNLLLSGGKIYITDFERARYGCALWDIASLLYQPSLGISEDVRTQLARSALAGTGYTENDLLLFALFRLFRGVERRLESYCGDGSTYFVQTLPDTLSLIVDITTTFNLDEISEACDQIIKKLRSDP